MSQIADRPTLSIIIPTCSDAPHLAATVGHALLAAGGDKMEFIISDFGSTDETLSQARKLKVKTIADGSCRIDAMNRAVTLAAADTLMFLPPHARVPDFFDLHIERSLRASNVAGGAFEMGVSEHPHWGTAQRAWFSFVVMLQHSRCRWGGHVSRDTVVFARKDRFEQIGGFRHDARHPTDRLCADLRRAGEVAIIQSQVHVPWRGFTPRAVFRRTMGEMPQVLGLRLHPAKTCPCNSNSGHDLPATSRESAVTIRSTTGA